MLSKKHLDKLLEHVVNLNTGINLDLLGIILDN